MKTLNDLFFHLARESAGRSGLLTIQRSAGVTEYSTEDFVTAVHLLAIALERRGVKPGDRVALFAENCPEWHVVDFACHLLGAISVPLYPSLPADQVLHILVDSGASWVFCSDPARGSLVDGLGKQLRRPVETVTLDSTPDSGSASGQLSLAALQEEGARHRDRHPLEHFRGHVDSRDLASLIYTSGTTGEPKGVMLSHHNFTSNVLACSELFPLGPSDQALSFLPLSHVFERTVDYLFLYRGVAIHYAPSIERMPPLLTVVRPTVMCSVPRVYERAFLRVVAMQREQSGLRRKLFEWALRTGDRHAKRGERGSGPWLGTQRLVADRLVFRKVKERFGGRLRFAISGGAPLAPAAAEFFAAVGLSLYQGYGLTETAPVLTANRPGEDRQGSVGKAVPGVSLKIAADGEILARTPGLMKGYWQNPEATREVVDEEGWFATGDIGHLDDDGFLFITDRKKDLLITSGGKNVAPQPIEQRLTAEWSIAQAVVVGDRYPYLTALIVPRFDDLPTELATMEREPLIADPRLLRIIRAAVDEVNGHLADHERIRRWRLMPREFSQDNHEITPTQKVRRRVIVERYAEDIAAMYTKTQRVAAPAKLAGGRP